MVLYMDYNNKKYNIVYTNKLYVHVGIINMEGHNLGVFHYGDTPIIYIRHE